MTVDGLDLDLEDDEEVRLRDEPLLAAPITVVVLLEAAGLAGEGALDLAAPTAAEALKKYPLLIRFQILIPI